MLGEENKKGKIINKRDSKDKQSRVTGSYLTNYLENVAKRNSISSKADFKLEKKN